MMRGEDAVGWRGRGWRQVEAVTGTGGVEVVAANEVKVRQPMAIPGRTMHRCECCIVGSIGVEVQGVGNDLALHHSRLIISAPLIIKNFVQFDAIHFGVTDPAWMTPGCLNGVFIGYLILYKFEKYF